MFDAIALVVTISAAVLLWRAISVLRQDVIKENGRMRAALLPILRHADQSGTAPPLRLSVEDCRRIKEMVNAK